MDEKVKKYRKRLKIRRQIPEKIELKIADEKEKFEAYELLKQAYINKGFWPEDVNADNKLFYHNLSDTVCFNAYDNNVLKGSLSLFRDGTHGLPLDHIFSEDIQFLRNEHRGIVEVGALVSVGNDIISPFYLYKILFNYASTALSMDDLLITVHPNHQYFYRALLCAEPLGEIKDHQSVGGAPAVLLRMNLQTSAETMLKLFPRQPEERDFHHFFIDERPAFFPGEVFKSKIFNNQR